MSPDLGLLRMRPAVLYHLDAAGCLVAERWLTAPPAPRLAVWRSPRGIIWRWRHDLPIPLAAALHRICATEPVPFALGAPPQRRTGLRALLSAHAPLAGEYRGPAFIFDEQPEPSGAAVPVAAHNAHLLQPDFPRLTRVLDAIQPCVALLRDGRAVSVCYAARTHRLAAEAGVETLPAYRGRGLATEATAGWAATVRRQGRAALYSTAWTNTASLGVARRLRLRPFAEDWSLR